MINLQEAASYKDLYCEVQTFDELNPIHEGASSSFCRSPLSTIKSSTARIKQPTLHASSKTPSHLQLHHDSSTFSTSPHSEKSLKLWIMQISVMILLGLIFVIAGYYLRFVSIENVSSQPQSQAILTVYTTSLKSHRTSDSKLLDSKLASSLPHENNNVFEVIRRKFKKSDKMPLVHFKKAFTSARNVIGSYLKTNIFLLILSQLAIFAARISQFLILFV